MHVFTRSFAIASGHAGEALVLAVAVARDASDATGLAVSPWVNAYGAPPHAIVFGAAVDSPAEVARALEAVGCGGIFAGAPLDAVGEVVSGGRGCSQVPLFADVVTAEYPRSARRDALSYAVDSGREITDRTGLRTVVVRDRSSATLRRITFAETRSDVDDAEQQLAGAWLLPGTICRGLVRRLR